jgi:DNA transformation protein
MAARNAFVEHCLELLAPAGAVRARRMFGGWGLYLDELFVAIVAFERLWLKADETTRPRFADAGSEIFTVEMKGRPTSMNYWSAPPEAMESPALMAPWLRLAVEAALRQRSAPAATRASAKRRPPRG